MPRRAGRTSGSIDELGAFAEFSLASLRALAGVGRFASEVLRQAKILLVGTTGLMAFLMFVIGAEAALFGTYFLRSVGAQGSVGLITALADAKLLIPLMFGYVFAAKVGCGLVAEIGSMQISDEITAFESVGVDPMKFVVATRIAGALLFMVIAFPICALCANSGSFAMAVKNLGVVSSGGFTGTHWALQSVTDYLFSFTMTMTVGVTIVLVACFVGFRVRGGPVEVGTATSRSMVANLVLVHVLVGGMTSIIYGPHPNLPIGG